MYSISVFLNRRDASRHRDLETFLLGLGRISDFIKNSYDFISYVNKYNFISGKLNKQKNLLPLIIFVFWLGGPN
jgi:hypothetical protein